jgi:hypothetical protein
MPLPWEALDGALAALDDATRIECPEAIEEAQEAVDFAKDRLALFVATVFSQAATGCYGYIPPKVWEAISDRVGVKPFLEEMRLANWKAQEAMDRIDGLRNLIRALEKRVDDLTEGVKEPK